MPTEAPETKSKTRDADRTRDAILHAGQQIFAKKGFVETGVRDITDRAGVNQALVSRYFGGKLKLFEAVLEKVLDARAVTELNRKNFGEQVVANFILSTPGRVNPLPILLGAVADSNARGIALRLLHERIFIPFSIWFGSKEAEARAARADSPGGDRDAEAAHGLRDRIDVDAASRELRAECRVVAGKIGGLRRVRSRDVRGIARIGCHDLNLSAG